MNWNKTAFVALATTLTLALPSAHAQVVGATGTITSLLQDTGTGRAGDLFIELSSGPCISSDGSSGPYVVSGADPKHAALLSLALAALLNRSNVRTGRPTGSCVITSLQMTL